MTEEEEEEEEEQKRRRRKVCQFSLSHSHERVLQKDTRANGLIHARTYSQNSFLLGGI